MKRVLPPALLTLLLAVTACTGQEEDPATPADDQAAERESDMEAMEEYEEEMEGVPTVETVALGVTHDFGDGVTIAMTDLRREVEEDGFNSTTGEEGALPYVTWSWELTNGSGTDIQLGGETSSCHVGDPLAETEQPVLGTSINPPDMLADGQSATWEADCWMAEDETALQYTLELYDASDMPVYSVIFAGDVPQ